VTIELDGELLDDIRAGYLTGYKLDEPDPFLDLRSDRAKVLAALTSPTERTKRRKHQPNIRKMIAEAEKSGKRVTSVTTREGVTLTFGEPDAADDAEAARNLWKQRHARHA
jgi:hypothetical protein